MDDDTALVLQELRELLRDERRPITTAPELAERLPWARRHTLQLLERLQAAGHVDSHPVGRGRAWWPTEHEPTKDDTASPPAEPLGEPSAEPPAEPPAEPSEETEPEPEPEPDRPDQPPAVTVSTEIRAELGPDLEQLDLPGSGEALEERRAAVRACYEYLHLHGTGRKSEFLEHVYPNHQARYSSEAGWWNAIGKRGLQQLAELRPEISPPGGEGSHVWRWSN